MAFTAKLGWANGALINLLDQNPSVHCDFRNLPILLVTIYDGILLVFLFNFDNLSIVPSEVARDFLGLHVLSLHVSS